MLTLQPGEIPLPRPRAQVEHERGDAASAGLGDGAHRRLQLVGRVAEVRQDRRHQHSAPDARIGEGPTHSEPGARRWRAGFDLPPQRLVDTPHRDVDRDVGDFRSFAQQIEIA